MMVLGSRIHPQNVSSRDPLSPMGREIPQHPPAHMDWCLKDTISVATHSPSAGGPWAAAMEVRNMALDTQEVWKHVTKRYAPIFRSVPSPLLPTGSHPMGGGAARGGWGI